MYVAISYICSRKLYRCLILGLHMYMNMNNKLGGPIFVLFARAIIQVLIYYLCAFIYLNVIVGYTRMHAHDVMKILHSFYCLLFIGSVIFHTCLIGPQHLILLFALHT